MLASQSQRVSVENGESSPSYNGVQVVTSEDGSFRFPPQPNEYTVVALHDDGFALVERDKLKSAPRVRIEPWSRLKGRLQVGGRPLAFQTVALRYFRRPSDVNPRIQFVNRTETDANGYFVLKTLVPGEARLGHVFRSNKPTDGSIQKGYGHGVYIEIPSGRTSEVLINAEGRSVSGSVVLPPDSVIEPDWARGTLHLELIRPLPRERPKSRGEIASWQKWYDSWWATPEGKAYRKSEWSLRRPLEP